MSKKGGGGGYRAPVEDPNTLQSNQRVTIVDTISEGPIVGLVDGDKSIALNYTPLRTPEGALTYQDVSWDTRLGLPDQPAYHDVPGAEAEQSVGVEVTRFFPRASGTGSGAVTRQLNNTDATHVRITLMVQGLYEQIVDNQDRAGDTTAATVGYRIVIRNNNGNVIVDHATERRDKTMGQAQWATKFALDGNGPWTITVHKTTADSEKANVKTDLYWSSYTEIVGYPMVYPHTASVLLRGTAETFGGSVPSRCYRVKGLKIQVPSNYDPETRQYSGIWDGTFKTAWTDNPAWVLRDLIMSPRYGLRKFFPPAQQGRELIDKWTLYQLAQYCDQTVPDGKGGAEPRYTFNGQIMGSGEAKEVIQAIASVFHGMTYWSSGMLFARADVPGDPVKLLSQANVIGGLLTYNTGSAQARHSVAVVTWYDPDDYGRPCVETVYDMDAYHRYGYRPIDVTAYGCTSRGQARRQGLWTLLTENEQWQCTVKVGLDCYDLLPGDFVRVADPTAMGIRFSGRVRSIDGAAVTLDAPVTLAEGETYKLAIIMADGKEEAHNVVTRGETDTLAVDAPFTGSAVESALWYISGSDAAPRLFAVRSITEKTDDGSAALELSLREVHLEKYAKLEDAVAFTETPGKRRPRGALALPVGLQVVESTYSCNGTALQRLVFSWDATGDPEVSLYEPQYKSPAGDWTTFEPQKSYSVDVPAAAQGEYLFRVRSASIDGRFSEWAEVTYTSEGTKTKPLPVGNLRAKGGQNSVAVTWTIPQDFMAGYFEVWMSADEQQEHAQVKARLYGDNFTVMGLDASTPYWFWVRTVGITGGTYSDMVGPAAAVTEAVKPPEIPDGILGESKLTDVLRQKIQSVDDLTDAVVHNAVDVAESNAERDGLIASAKLELGTRITAQGEAIAYMQTELQAQIDQHYSQLQQTMQATATLDGRVSALYTLRTDVNGHIAGFGLSNDGEMSEFVILADKFRIVGPNDPAGAPGTQVFAVDSATGAVVIQGNLFVDSAGKAGNGWIRGEMISASSKIQLANGSIVLDGTTGIVRVFDPADHTNGNYMEITSGHLRQYRYGKLGKTLSAVESGSCPNGQSVTLNNTYKAAPSVSVSPQSIQTYNPNLGSQTQTLQISATAPVHIGNGKYKFTPQIRLISESGALSITPVPSRITNVAAYRIVRENGMTDYPQSKQTSGVATPTGIIAVTVAVRFYVPSAVEYIILTSGGGYNEFRARAGTNNKWRIAYRAHGQTAWSYGAYSTTYVNPPDGESVYYDTLTVSLPQGQYDIGAQLNSVLSGQFQSNQPIRPIPTAGDSWFEIVSITVSKPGATQLATGTVNYIAIGE